VSRATWRALQWVAVIAVLVFVGMQMSEHWVEIRALPGTIAIDWALMGVSGLAVLASYAVLIWTWQRMVNAWGERLGFAEAARIWFISNLGRYIPGKVWQIGAMGMMAQQAGVSATAAVGSSLVIAIINILAGSAVAFATGARDLGAPSWALPAVVIAAMLTAATPWLLPIATQVAARLLKREIKTPELPASSVWIAAVGCAIAWVLYGVAFHFMMIALVPTSTGDVVRSTAAFTASYIAGFVFLFSPGGLGVREEVMFSLLGSFSIAFGAKAWLIVIASRVWLTVIEVLPGLILLLIRREPKKPLPPQAA
jgi:uncharacterized membrane protein YbhN (UPF0104 family)